jgi:hypothetical protein
MEDEEMAIIDDYDKELEVVREKARRIRSILEGAKTGEPFRAIVYRGVSDKTPVDEGIYGKGTYYTLNVDYAREYARIGRNGRVIVKEIYLRNPFVGTAGEVEALGCSAVENAIKEGKGVREQREAFSRAITEKLKSMGYDGIIIRDGNDIVVFDDKDGGFNIY